MDDIVEVDETVVDTNNRDGFRTPSPNVFYNESLKKIDENEEKKKEKESEEKENPSQMEIVEVISSEGPTKRGREEEEEWQNEILDNNKKLKMQEKIEVYASCAQKLPKQFALAKLFKELGILDISRIKYLSPYKIRVEFENEICMDKMITCKILTEKGWSFQRAYQVSYTYGIIRDVDIDLTEQEIMKSIQCDSRSSLTSATRLKRRGTLGEWVQCETVRLGFKGSYLPTHVKVDGLRIKVEPYIFPVSQCSKCWKLGHPHTRCPSHKIVCPKCSKNHANCDTTTFVCVNCKGSHMSLNKAECPEFLKEKKIRVLMSEFNCTYRQARMMYVSKSPAQDEYNDEKNIFNPESVSARTENAFEVELKNSFSPLTYIPTDSQDTNVHTYASIVKINADVHSPSSNSKVSKISKKKRIGSNFSSRFNSADREIIAETMQEHTLTASTAPRSDRGCVRSI